MKKQRKVIKKGLKYYKNSKDKIKQYYENIKDIFKERGKIKHICPCGCEVLKCHLKNIKEQINTINN